MKQEKFDLENFPTSVSAQKMLSYVSNGFYDNSYVGKWMYQVMGLEYDKVLEIVENLPAQFFPESATWGLMYHEIKWGLAVRENLSYEERRRLIYQKRDYHLPMTPYRMERSLEEATGFEVHVADACDPGKYGFIPEHPNIFKTSFLGEGSLDCRKIFGILDRLKQSHTIYLVDHRTELVLNNKHLEQIVQSKIILCLSFTFFSIYILNGQWKIDGSVSQNQSHKACMDIRLSIGTRVCCDEFLEMEVIIRKDLWCLDGSIMIDGTRMLDAEIRKEII